MTVHSGHTYFSLREQALDDRNRIVSLRLIFHQPDIPIAGRDWSVDHGTIAGRDIRLADLFPNLGKYASVTRPGHDRIKRVEVRI